MRRGHQGHPSRVPLALSLLTLAGCAVDTHGLVSVQHHETPTATILTLQALGLHLSTYAVDRGLTLGWVERTYALPKPGRAGDAGGFASSVGGADLARHRARPATGGGLPTPDDTDPVLVAVRRAGLGLDANPQRIGLMLGFQERTALTLPAAGSTLVVVRFDLRRPETTTLIIAGEP
jgi:hypothetical protein